MAKQAGIQFTGRMDGYSFYQDRLHGYLVRRTGGVTSKQYRRDERYAAARDASSEFASVSKAGKLIRDALREFILPVKDGTMVNRMNKELVALKQLDMLNPRGSRRAETMIADQGSNQGLRAFQFNEEMNLPDLVYRCEISRSPTVCYVKPRECKFPEGATHAGLTLIKVVIDFERKCFQTLSSRMGLIAKSDPEGIHLVLPGPGSLTGVEISCLQLLFFREENGTLIQLERKCHSMGIVDVSRVSK